MMGVVKGKKKSAAKHQRNIFFPTREEEDPGFSKSLSSLDTINEYKMTGEKIKP
jgi:hypothetical protein